MALSINSFVQLYEALNLGWRASNTVPLGGASLVLPAYAAPRVLSATRPSGVTITEATLVAAEALERQGRRVDAYLLLANATQNQQFLLTAQISSGSGVWVGGPAINVNAALQLAYPSVYPTFSITEFSNTILRTEINEIRKRSAGTPNTYFAPSELEVLEDAREEGWLRAKGVEDSNLRAIFPGNLLLLYHYAKTGNQLKYDEIIAADGESRVRDLLLKTGLAAWSEATDHGPQFGLTRAQAQARAAQGGSVETQTVIGQQVTIYKDATGAAFALFRPQDDLVTDTQPGLGLSSTGYNSANDPFRTGGSTAGYLLASAANFLGNSATDPEKVALNNFINATKTTNATNPQFNQSVVETVAALHRLLVNPQAAPPATGDAAEALVRLTAIVKKDELSTTQSLAAIVGKGNDALAAAAMADSTAGKAYRYALQNLHLVALTNADYSKLGTDVDSGLALKTDATPTGMTQQYIADRSNLMYWNIQRNLANNPSAISGGPGVQGMHFKDVKASLEFDLGLPDNVVEKRQTLFGGDGADPLVGKKLGDHLYGGAGNDTLDGKAGNDYLEGGAGQDTYLFAASAWGQDTIVDADGSGSITLGSTLLGTGKRWGNSPNVWLDESETYLIAKVRADGAPEGTPATEQTSYNLIIARKDKPAEATITVKGWTPDKNLGLTLGSTVTEAPSANANSDIWTYQSINKVADGTGNFSARLNPAVPGEGMRDYQASGAELTGTSDFISSSASAQFIRGDLNNHSIKLGDGNNLVTTSEYSVSENEDTVLQAGIRKFILPGDDTIVTGSGSDIIFAGGGSNFIDSGDGDDFIAAGGTLAAFGSIGTSGTPGLLGIYAAQTVTAENIASQSGISSYRPGLGPWGTYSEANSDNRQGAGLQLYGADFEQDFNGWSGQAGTASQEFNAPSVVYAGAGNDKVIGSSSDDLIVLGQGNDFASGYMGNDEIFGDGGDDWVLGDGVYFTDAQWLGQTSASQNLRRSDSGNDALYGGDGNDVLMGQAGNDILEGDAGDDDLYGDDANYLSDYLNGSYISAFGASGQYAGEDYLDGGDGSDQLIGGGKNDQLYGGNGNDTLWGDNDRPAQLQAADHGSDYLDGEAGDDVLFGGGKDDTLVGGTGDDQLYGQDGNDTYILTLGDSVGSNGDYIADTQGINTLQIDGVAASDIALGVAGQSGTSLILAYGNEISGNAENKVTVENALTSAVITTLRVDGQSINFAEFVGKTLKTKVSSSTTSNGQQLTGGAVSDSLTAGNVNATVSGGQGNDNITLAGRNAGSTVQIRSGEGVDSIGGSDALRLGGSNTIAFGSGIASSDIKVTRGLRGAVVLSTGSLVEGTQAGAAISGSIGNVSFANSGQTLTLAQLVQASVAAQQTSGNDIVEGSALDDAINGEAGNDVLLGFEGDDTLIADGGNDLLEGGEGNDTYVIGPTAGQVTLLIGLEPGQTALAAGTDRIVLAGSKAQNLWTAARVDNSLVLTAQQVGNSFTSSVRLEGYFDSGVGSAVWSAATVEFSDGGALTVQELLASTSLATEGNDVIYGGLGNDVIDALAGDDTVFSLAGDDAVYAGLGNDMVDAGDGDDLVDGGAGNDMLAGGNGNDTLRGGADNDVISGDAGADTLWGDAGDDTLLGGLGADRLNGGDGADLIDGGDGADQLDGAAGDDQLLGGSGNDRLDGGDGNDTLTGGAGADQLAGGAGNDVYVFDANLPGQADAIDDVQGINVIRLDGVMGADASALRNAVQVFGGDNNDYTVIWGKGSVRIAGGAEALSRMRLDVDGVQTALTDYLVTTPTSVPGSTQTQLNANFLTQREARARAEIAYAGSIGALAWRYEPGESSGAFLQPISSDAATADVSQSSFLQGSTPYFYTYNGYRNAAGQFFTSNTTTTSVTSYTYTLTRYDNNRNLSSPGPVTVVNYTNSVTTETTSLIPGLTPVSERRTGYTSGYTFIPAAASVDAQLGDAANTFTFSAGLVRGGGGDDQITANLASFSRETYAANSYYGVPYPVNAARTIKLSERNTTLLTGLTTATWIDGGNGNDTIVGSEAADIVYGGSGFNSLDAGVGPDRYLVLDQGVSNAGFDYIADTGISMPLRPDLSEAYGGLAQEVLPPGVDIDTVEFGPGIELNELQFSVKTRDQSFATYYGGSPQSLLPYGVDIDAAAFGAGIQFDPTFFNPTVGRRGRSPYLVVERDGRRLAAIELVTFNPESPSSGAGVEFLQFQDGQKITLRTAVQSAFAQPVNQSPVVLSALTQQQTPEDSAWSFNVPLATFTDTDGKPLAYSATRSDGSPLPNWLSFDTATRTFSGSPQNANVGELALNVVATDSMGLSANANFILSVTNVNDIPVVSSALTSQSATQGTLWEYVLPSDLFTEVDVGDTLTLSATLIDGTMLPSWLRFDVATGIFSGRPLGSNVGNLDVKVTATDKAGAQVSSEFSVNVSSTNHAPVAALLLDQQAIETQAFSYTLPLNIFTDVDSGDNLTLNATLFNGTPLPEWLSFNTVTRTFNGTPPDTASGLVAVTVTATDEQGASASSTFNLSVANILNGTTQDDVLVGTAGNDVTDGGLGADRMSGGKGDDMYFIDNVFDKVVEKVAEGRDSVRSTVTYTLAANVEDLVLIGTAVIDGVGNALDNRIQGNSVDNKLVGGAGNDVLVGGAGDDWLRGGADNDMLTGGTGDDLYEVDTAGDVVIERAGEGVDTVEASVSYSLSDNVENLFLTGTLAVDGLGNALDNVLQGNDANNVLTGAAGNDTLNGKKGIDTLAGGLGNDTYLLEDDVDTIVELVGEGRDVVISRFTLNLGANIEDGVLLGSATDIVGNELSNVLTGNNAGNTINGGAGADVMLGGKGNDIYVVDSQADTIIEVAGEGTDTVQALVNYTLTDNIENLILTGTAEAGRGNSLNNRIIGNAASNKLFGDAGNDDLDGGEGADILVGDLGNDDYWVDSSSDLVVEAANEGTDTVYASVSYALADNVERLVLTGSANINAVGNAGNNRLEGNAGDNILFGGLGNDTYVFGRGSGHDVVANFDAGKPSGDLVQLGAGITSSDINLLRQGNDLVLRINGSDDRLTVASYFENGGKGANALEKIRFADGTSLDHAAVLSKATVSSGVSDAQGIPTGVRIGDPTALFNAPDAAASKTKDAAITPQSVAESISQAKARFEQTLQNLKIGTNEQGGLSRSEFAERRALPLLWNLQDALLSLQLAKNADGRFTADVSIDSRATRDLGLGISMLGATSGVEGQLNQVARPGEVQQFDLAQIR